MNYRSTNTTFGTSLKTFNTETTGAWVLAEILTLESLDSFSVGTYTESDKALRGVWLPELGSLLLKSN